MLINQQPWCSRNWPRAKAKTALKVAVVPWRSNKSSNHSQRLTFTSTTTTITKCTISSINTLKRHRFHQLMCHTRIMRLAANLAELVSRRDSTNLRWPVWSLHNTQLRPRPSTDNKATIRAVNREITPFKTKPTSSAALNLQWSHQPSSTILTRTTASTLVSTSAPEETAIAQGEYIHQDHFTLPTSKALARWLETFLQRTLKNKEVYWFRIKLSLMTVLPPML